MKYSVNRKSVGVFGAAGLALLLAASLTLTPVVTEADGLRQENTRPDWPMPNFNEHNTRNAPESTIDSSNVNTLGEVWAFEIPGMGNAYGGAASNPLIADGTVYFQDLGSNVFAIDLETGEVQWEHMFDTPVTGPNGPGLNQERVFVGIGQDTVVALDRATGEEVWRTVVDGPTGYSQLAALDNTVYLGTGTRAYTPGVSGFIYALNADDGSVKWQFQTVEEGFWGAPEINSGAGVWYPPALDLERGVGYWGTGNPAPFAGIVGWPNGSSRPGPNLYANSTLALDLEAGELQWYDQPNPHDVFDLDFQSPRILTTATVNGSERTIVVASGKLGRVIANDVETGEQLWDTEVGEHQNDDAAGVNPGETLTV
ncbi:MAG: hypothetical protein EHM35_15925, partial [Planctomycetaceae bacterium]